MATRAYLSSCGSWAFVLAEPGRPHRYVKTHPSVMLTPCPTCGAPFGEGCRRKDGGVATDTHYTRRYAATAEKRKS